MGGRGRERSGGGFTACHGTPKSNTRNRIPGTNCNRIPGTNCTKTALACVGFRGVVGAHVNPGSSAASCEQNLEEEETLGEKRVVSGVVVNCFPRQANP
eukprot:145058-Rhodomonas_salina.1